MTMQTMQTILCRATVDRRFQAMLLSAPDDVAREYQLGNAEARILTGSRGSHTELAAAVEAWRRGEPVSVPARELMMAS